MSGEAAVRQRALEVIVDVAPLSRWAKLAYYQLCTLMRITGTGLDNDDAYLRDVAAIRGWRKVKDELIRRGGFFVDEDGLFWNARVRDELAAARATSLQRSGAARSKNRKKGQPDAHQREILYPIGRSGAHSGEHGFAGPAAAHSSPFGGSGNGGFAGFPAPMDGIETARYAGSAAGDPRVAEAVAHAGSKPELSSGNGAPVGLAAAGLARAADSRISDDDDDLRDRSRSSSSSSPTPAVARADGSGGGAETGPPLPAQRLNAPAELLADAFFAARRSSYPGETREPSRGKTVMTAAEMAIEHLPKFEGDLGAMVAVIDEVMTAFVTDGRAAPQSIAFCKIQMKNAAAKARHRRRDASGGTSDNAAAAAVPLRYDTPWNQRMVGFRRNGFWHDSWGAKPGEPGCDVPDDLLTPDELERKRGPGPAAAAAVA